MTKPRMQGKIGYYANGVLVHMPNSRTCAVSSDKKMLSQHAKRNKARVRHLQQLKKKKQSQLRTSYSSELVINTIPLKHASKRGDFLKAIFQLKLINKMGVEYNKTNNPAQYIFYPDIEQRSALYYAAHTGHHDLVEFYLSIYLIYTVEVSAVSIKLSRTYKEWFNRLGMRNMGLVKKFNMAEYNTCVLNSLNNEVRHVMTKKNINIQHAIDVVLETISNNTVFTKKSERSSIFFLAKVQQVQAEMERVRKLAKKSKVNKNPSLKYDDRFDDGFYDDEWDSYHDDENEDVVDNGNENNVDNATTKEADESILGSYSMIGYSEAASAYGGESAQDFSFIGYSEAQSSDVRGGSISSDYFDATGNDDNVPGDFQVEWDIRSEDFSMCSDEDFELIQEKMGRERGRINVIEEREEEQDGREESTTSSSQLQDEISDVRSVKSLDDALPSSYKDALLKKSLASPQPSHPPQREVIKRDHDDLDLNPDSNPKTISVNNEEELGYDAELQRDYYKSNRGGKSSRMFRGEGRTCDSVSSWGFSRHEKSKIKRKERPAWKKSLTLK